ncbi:MAG: PRC-barrel domain-containing protein [Thermoleophilia bacterium]|nr:PRC-barrel domain-containing protein [Thermoleophilia bacterium]
MSDDTDRHEPDDDAARIGPEAYPDTTRLPSLSRIRGMDVCDESGDRVGKVSDVFLDADARYVRYLVVGTGMMGRRRGAIPIDEVRYVDDGDGDPRIVVPYSRDHLAAAPALEDGDELSPEREHAIYDHYRRAGYWEEARQAVRARQATPAPTPEVAQAEAVADMNRQVRLGHRPRVRRLQD